MHLRLQVVYGRRITHKALAKMAGASERAIAEWMRGSTAPMAMTAILNLLSRLEPKDAEEILSGWREVASVEVITDEGASLETFVP